MRAHILEIIQNLESAPGLPHGTSLELHLLHGLAEAEVGLAVGTHGHLHHASLAENIPVLKGRHSLLVRSCKKFQMDVVTRLVKCEMFLGYAMPCRPKAYYKKNHDLSLG